MMARRDEHAPLTPDERRFVDELIHDNNATRAYRAVYPGSSYAAAKVSAHRLVTKANLRAEIRAARRAQQRRTQIKADAVLKELASIAFADPGDCYDDYDRPRPLKEIPLETRRAISEVLRDRRTGEVTGYRFFKKVEALERLSRHLGLDAGVPPLEALLAAFPQGLAAEVRSALCPTSGNGVRHFS